MIGLTTDVGVRRILASYLNLGLLRRGPQTVDRSGKRRTKH